MTVTTVLSGPERRRRWTSAEKLRIVEESLATDAVVSEVARRYDIHPNQLRTWRQRARLGLLTSDADRPISHEPMAGFVPVMVATGRGIANASLKANAEGMAAVELVLRNGRVLRLPDGIVPARAAALADALEGLAR